MKIEIISPEKVLFRGEAEAVTLPGVMGSFTIMHNHAPIISILKKGTIEYGSVAGSKATIPVESGFVEGKNNIISICVEQ